MKVQIIVKRAITQLKLVKGKNLIAESTLQSNCLSEKLLEEIDRLFKENKIEKKQLEKVEVLSQEKTGGSVGLARVISMAGNYCLTK